MEKVINGVLIFLSAFILSACAGMQNPDVASPESDLESKKFEPSPGKSKIYIVRPSKFGGKGIYVHPMINKVVAGHLVSGSYLMLDVLPGNYSISAAGNLEKPGDVEIAAEAGKLYFVKMYPKVKIGIMVALSPGLHNEIINAEEGRRLVLKSKRYKEVEYTPSQRDRLSGEKKGTLYMFRPKTLRGSASNHKLSPTVDDKVVGSLERGTYLATKIAPGRHKISAAGKFEGEYVLWMEISEKKHHYVKITPKMGFALPKLELKKISREEGDNMMDDCQLISNP